MAPRETARRREGTQSKLVRQTKQKWPTCEFSPTHLLPRLIWNPGFTEIQTSTRLPVPNAQKENGMKNCTSNQITRRILPIACAAALAAVFTVSLPAYAGQLTPPTDVPHDLQVPEGNKLFLVGNALGTQNYVCVPSTKSATGVAYALFTPEATLFSTDDGGQIITHFFSPNPHEVNPSTTVVAPGGRIRATWVHSHDGSTVWAKLHTNGSATVNQDAIDWLLLDTAGVENGPTGGDILAKSTFVQRLHTTGGLAPLVGCGSPSELGNQAFIPYTADYLFYTNQ
jgi:hypothetical protein